MSFKMLVAGFSCLLVGGCLLGCTVTGQNAVVYHAKFTQGFEFGHSASKTSDEKATAKVEIPSLTYWIESQKQDAKKEDPDAVPENG